jgi:gamma-glutamyltranspeptidase/glutathione hydrolase
MSLASRPAGIVVSPERRASQAGAIILREGGSAIEAAIATAAMLAVTYPHMTGLGGDAFWLVMPPGGKPVAIMGCGRAGRLVSRDLYRGPGAIPARGPLAANTVAGAVSSWAKALDLPGASRLPLTKLFDEAIRLAETGTAMAPSLARTITDKAGELKGIPGWQAQFGEANSFLALPRLGQTLRLLATDGLDGFYRGELAADIARDLEEVGSPIGHEDLASHDAKVEEPLRVTLRDCTAFNTPAPTQGLASLLILALLDALPSLPVRDPRQIHTIIEATKLAFAIRNRDVHEPARMTLDAQALLDDSAALTAMARSILPDRAAPWPHAEPPGDTVWIGVADRDGWVVSLIQSIYFEFGSGIVLPRAGLVWQNRGASFRLAEDGWNALQPGARPFHTLNPALARFDDGRVMAYGTMGGEGQPQTQTAVFGRYARDGLSLAEAIAAPRWLLGRTWGDETTALRLESRFEAGAIDALRGKGHSVQMVEDYSDLMGHAGALVRRADGSFDGASDPRCDGAAEWA